MKINIERNSSILAGAMIKNKVWVNGELTDKVAHGEEKEMDIPDKNSVLQVKQFSGKSNKLVVSEGDNIEISHAPWLMWAYLFLFVLGGIYQALNLFNTPIFYITILLIGVIFYRGVNAFRLTKRHGTK